MELRHEFTVPAGVQEAWDHFGDIESVATCFPGAQVTSVEGDTFAGQVKVKLGPIALVYTGSGTFVEKDDAAHRFVVEAKGRDKRGNGTAGATVTLTMTENGPESTGVEVLTDLAVTGKPAQFGRGVMQDVSDKLLGQFTDCLERQVRSGPEPAGASAAATPSSGDALSGTAPDSSSESTPLAAATGPAASGGGLLAASSSASNGSGSGSSSGGGLLAAAGAPSVSAGPVSTDGSDVGDTTGSSGASSDASPVGTAQPEDEGAALDLGATVLPVLAKAYWKQALGVVIALVVLRKLLGSGGED